MAEVSVLQPRATQGSAIQDATGATTFVFDATIAEAHDQSADVTMHPVERATDVTDHVQIQPTKLTLTGVITATPNDPENEALDLAAGVIPGLRTTVVTNPGLIEQGRVGDQFLALRALMLARAPVTVVTGLVTYADMILVSIRTPRGAKQRQEIRPTLEFVQVRFADSITVPVPAEIVAASARTSGSSKSKLGKQATSEATAQQVDLAAKAKAQLESLRSQSAASLLFGGA